MRPINTEQRAQQQEHYHYRSPDARSPVEVSEAACPHCQKPVLLDSDCCPHCMAWLLEEQCCFCYSPVKAGQQFCGKCGNKPQGNHCKVCQTFSVFDYCPKCEAPVSRDAVAFLDRLSHDQEIMPLIAEIMAIQEATTEKQPDHEQPDWLMALEVLRKKAVKESPDLISGKANTYQPNTGFFKGEEKVDAASAVNRAEQRRAANTAQSNATEKIAAVERQVAQIQKRLFQDNQSARKFYTAVKILLPVMEVVRNRSYNGWQCNYTGTVHENPDGCARPDLGGTWIYDENIIYKTDFKEI